MPAVEKSLSTIRRLGILAGGGEMPEKLVLSCDAKGIEPFIVGFDGHTFPDLVKNRNHMWTRLGAAGKIISTLKSHDISDLVFIGSITRPGLAELRPDFKAAKILARIGLMSMGDSGLLSNLRALLEDEGFSVHGVHKFVDNLLAPEEVIGAYAPKKGDWEDIWRGIEVSQELGRMDIGQAAIVQEGVVLGVEGVEGTDQLIQRCRHLKKKGRKGVLVKTCKPQQDHDLDLPAIGPETVRQAADCDLAGIVIHAGHSLILDIEKVAEIADHHKMFVIGVDPSKKP